MPCGAFELITIRIPFQRFRSSFTIFWEINYRFGGVARFLIVARLCTRDGAGGADRERAI